MCCHNTAWWFYQSVWCLTVLSQHHLGVSTPFVGALIFVGGPVGCPNTALVKPPTWLCCPLCCHNTKLLVPPPVCGLNVRSQHCWWHLIAPQPWMEALVCVGGPVCCPIIAVVVHPTATPHCCSPHLGWWPTDICKHRLGGVIRLFGA